jgi:adenylosuccinate lyase
MFTAIEMLALSKALGSKDKTWARDAVVAGEYPVDVTVRVSGTVTVDPDGDRAGTSKLLSEEFVMLALHMAGCTRERAVEIIRNIAGLADKKERKAALAEFDAEGRVAGLFAELKAAVPRTPVKGDVAFAGACSVVTSAAQEAVA